MLQETMEYVNCIECNKKISLRVAKDLRIIECSCGGLTPTQAILIKKR